MDHGRAQHTEHYRQSCCGVCARHLKVNTACLRPAFTMKQCVLLKALPSTKTYNTQIGLKELLPVCSLQGAQSTYRCLFQNAECLAKMGTARKQQEYLGALAQMPQDKQQAWADWVTRVMVSLTPMQTALGICQPNICTACTET